MTDQNPAAQSAAPSSLLTTLIPTICMGIVILSSNKLVLHPIQFEILNINLADLLTWGAVTYPVAFLVTDTTNRLFGPYHARKVVYFGFALGVALSLFDAIDIAAAVSEAEKISITDALFSNEDAFALFRVALASGTAFLIAQLGDVFIFNRLRHADWWKAPVISSFISSAVDTALFFSLAFAGTGLPWASWATGDFVAKLLMIAVLIYPFKILVSLYPERLKTSNF